MSANPPLPPENGGSAKDFLQRIERKANSAAILAQKSMDATLRLERALLGDYGEKGRIGAIEAELGEFIEATKQREKTYEDRGRFRLSNRIASITVIVMACGVLASIILTLLK